MWEIPALHSGQSMPICVRDSRASLQLLQIHSIPTTIQKAVEIELHECIELFHLIHLPHLFESIFEPIQKFQKCVSWHGHNME